MRISVFTILLLSMIDMAAQSVRGRVWDEDGKPIPYANVVLLTADSVFVDGTVTSDNGHFLFESSSRGKEAALLKITCFGFNPLYRACTVDDSIEIILNSHVNQLSEVTVTPPSYRMNGNGLVVSIQNSSLSKMDDLGRMLEFIPGLQSSNGGLHVFGKGTPLIYINGRILSDLTELERLKPSDIASVEIIRNPGSVYSASSQAVVKIKTVRKQGDGLSMDMRSYFQLAHKTREGLNWQANYRAGKLDMFVFLNYLHADDYNTESSVYDIKSDNPFTLCNSQKKDIAKNRYMGKVGFDYYFTQRQNVGAYFSYDYNDLDATGHENVTVSEYGATNDRQEYSTKSILKMPVYRVNAYYSGHIGSVDVSFSNDFYMSDNRQRQNVEGNSGIHGAQFAATSNHLKNRLVASDLSFRFDKGSSVWELGSTYNNTYRTNDYDSEGGIDLIERQKIVENKWAAYVDYSLSVGKCEIDAGLRYELYKYDYYRNGQHIDGQSKTYSNLYPSMDISYPVGDVQLNLSYSAKSQKPHYNALDGNIQYVSRNLYQGGNPLLKPSNIHTVELAMMYKGLTLSADYILMKNPLYFTYRFYNPEHTVILATYDNYPKVNIFQAVVSYSRKFGIWKPQLTVEVMAGDYKFSQSGKTFKYNQPLFTFDFNNIFTFPHQWYAYLLTTYQTSGCDEQGLRLKSKGRISIDLAKRWKNLSVDFLLNDITRSFKDSYRTISSACSFRTTRYNDTQNIQISIRYRFNATRSKYKGTDAAAEEFSRM